MSTIDKSNTKLIEEQKENECVENNIKDERSRTLFDGFLELRNQPEFTFPGRSPDIS